MQGIIICFVEVENRQLRLHREALKVCLAQLVDLFIIDGNQLA